MLAVTREILEYVAKKHDLPTHAILGPDRHAWVVEARHEMMWLMREHTDGMSYTRIGHEMGGLDHSSVRYGVMLHKKRMAAPPLTFRPPDA